jgi:predicted metal-binding membrane protein
MIYEIISVLILIDSVFALIIGFTKIGDNTIEKTTLFKRYLPLTTGWTLVYAALALYIGYLTFFVM